MRYFFTPPPPPPPPTSTRNPQHPPHAPSPPTYTSNHTSQPPHADTPSSHLGGTTNTRRNDPVPATIVTAGGIVVAVAIIVNTPIVAPAVDAPRMSACVRGGAGWAGRSALDCMPEARFLLGGSSGVTVRTRLSGRSCPVSGGNGPGSVLLGHGAYTPRLRSWYSIQYMVLVLVCHACTNTSGGVLLSRCARIPVRFGSGDGV